MGQNARRAGFFGDLVVDLFVKASRRRYGAERADPRRRPLQARRGHASAKKPRGKAVRDGRDPEALRNDILYFERPNDDRYIYVELKTWFFHC